MKETTTALALLASVPLTLLLPIGMLDAVSSWPFFALFFIHLGLLLFASAASMFSLGTALKASNSFLKLLTALATLIALVAIGSSVLLPVTARDALIHHLAIPKLWIEQGRILPTAWHEWSFYPMLIQLAFCGLLQLGPEQLCAIYIALFLPLILDVALRLTKLIGIDGEGQNFLVPVLLLTPLILRLAGIPLVDLPLAFFCGAGIHYLFNYQRGEVVHRSPILSGIAWGCALATKLNAIPAFAFSLLLSLGNCRRAKLASTQFVKGHLVIVAFAFLLYSPWLIRNQLWTENPFYPYLQSVFPSTIPHVSSGLSGLNPLQQRLMLYGESITEVIALPLRIFFQGEDDNPRLFDGRLSALFLLGLLFGLVNTNFQSRQLSLLSLSFIFFVLLSTGARVRYLAPALVPFAVLTAQALAQLSTRSGALRMLPTMLLSLQLLLSAGYVYTTYPWRAAVRFISGGLDSRDYLRTTIPEYSIIEFINTTLPQDSLIALVSTGNQFYLYQRQVISSGHTSADQVISWLREARSSDELGAKIQASGVTHFLIEEQRLSSVLQTALSEQQLAVWNEYKRDHFSPLANRQGFVLYQVR